MDQYCIIHGKKINERGQCPVCTPLPEPGTPGATEAELQAKLDKVTHALELITNEFNDVNGKYDAARKELDALKKKEADKCLGCAGGVCDGCKDRDAEISKLEGELAELSAKDADTEPELNLDGGPAKKTTTKKTTTKKTTTKKAGAK